MYNISLSSLKDTNVSLHSLTVSEAEKLLRSPMPYFIYIRKILEKITNLNQKELDNVSIQDAMSVLVYYRMVFWGDEEIAKTEDGSSIKPSDFIGTEEKEDDTIEIGGYLFSPIITLANAIIAEEKAMKSSSYKDNLRLFVLGAGCKGGVDKGIKVMTSIDASPESLGNMIAYTNAIKTQSSINIDMIHPSLKIMIETQGGEPIMALGFRASLFFAFWV